MSDPTRTGGRQPSRFAGERELVVLGKAGGATGRRGGIAAPAAGASLDSLEPLLRQYGARLSAVFKSSGAPPAAGRGAVAGRSAAAGAAERPPFYTVQVADDRKDELAQRLRQEASVEAAFVKPAPEPPVRPPSAGGPASTPAPPVPAPPAATGKFASRQIYLNKAPAGIDARFAWTRPGGRGAGINVIDIEGEWNFAHEDLIVNQGGMIGGSGANDLHWRNHGTAVVGEIGADRNVFGCTGIAPDARVRAISVFGGSSGSASAITQAADGLAPGDVILIELHFPGPRFAFAERPDQAGYIAAEWWPDNFAAIVYATSVRGVIVVEAAGNGAQNFDDPIYDTPAVGFPAGWKNPFRTSNPQSGAIVVGAGAPPPGTHGNNLGPDRSRLDFSNYGARVDVQGWGREVTTTGYGDLSGAAGPENRWYTDIFSGTSSASPIVVGALACLQGARKAAGKALLTPSAAQALLRNTGSPQQAGPNGPATQRIGKRPDLRAAFAASGVGGTPSRAPGGTGRRGRTGKRAAAKRTAAKRTAAKRVAKKRVARKRTAPKQATAKRSVRRRRKRA
jgi:hypothetical protein